MIDRLRILGKWYEIRHVEPGPLNDDCAARVECLQQVITIKTGMSDDHNIETILHESLHALDYDLSLELSERQVHALGASLLCLLRDNPALTRMIAGEGLKDGAHEATGLPSSRSQAVPIVNEPHSVSNGKETIMASKKSAAHPGFASVQKKIAKEEGVSKDAAGAILANAARNASPQAKAANPKLRKVKGK